MIARCCREAPAYAVPQVNYVIAAAEMRSLGLMTGNGRVRRAAIDDHYAAALKKLYPPAIPPMELEAQS